MPDGELGLRVRRIVSGDGEVLTSLSVYCPPRGESTPLDRCERCSSYRGARYHEGEARAFVHCHAPAHAEATAPVPVSSAMTTDVLCVTADLGRDALATLLLERGCPAAPVVDREGRPLGVVSQRELLDRSLDSVATAGELMTPVARRLLETAPLSQAALALVEANVQQLPVVSGEGAVVGLWSSFDAVRLLAREPAAGPPFANVASMERRRVLIVDREANALCALAELLREVGYEVATATRADDALPELARFRPDAILQAWRPGVSLDLVAAALACPQPPAIALMSSYPPPRDLAVPCFTRPIAVEQLTAALDRMIPRREAPPQNFRGSARPPARASGMLLAGDGAEWSHADES